MTLRHAISVDAEEWYQSTYDSSAPLSDRFEGATQKVLDAFAAVNVKATFFILGLAAEKAPQVVKAIVDAGHEIQSHGYGHVEVFNLSAEEFRQDLTRAKALLEDMTSQEIFGYRAPSFSIDERTPWAFDVLAETGHRYDSSIFPIKMRRYGVDGYPLEARIVTTEKGNRIVEAPVACCHFLGKRRPFGGGGYFRLLPYWIIRKALKQLCRDGRAAVIYMHPYEYDASEVDAYRDMLSVKDRLHQGLGRKGFSGKVNRMITEFPFGGIGDMIQNLLTTLS